MGAPESPSTAAPQKARSGNVYIAFALVLFAVVTRFDSLKAATVLALIASILIAAPAVLRGQPRQLELGAVVALAAFTVAAFAVDRSASDWLVRYARAIAAAITFLSLVGTPFTEQYARETVPKRYWSSPEFKRINRELTLMWACVFAAIVPSHIIAGAIDTRQGNTIFNWVIPIALLIWAVKRTERVSADTP
jgi:hypothetical protein